MKKQGADVIGAKAGAKPKKPYIQKDTIGSTQNAEIVYGIGDGENGGLINGLNSIILDGTRVIGSSGEVNFNEVKYEERFGLIDQPPLKLIEDTITERGLNLEVRSAAPVVSSFNNKDVDKFVVRISVPSLMQNKDNGDSVAATISYAIDISVDGGAYQTVLEASATEKITNGYEFDHEIDAPVGTQRTIRVRRTTPDSTSQLLIDKFYVAAISEVINAKFSHPTLHYIGLVFNAEQFNNIPKAVFHYYGRKIKVPVNYNPTTRSYTGIWNGTFKVVYSNNPAWVLFDILTDRRSGLGRRIPIELIDKWELYRIAQYCDELVPDGNGGMEPRFVCNNLVLNSKQDAYQVLKDIASIFRGQSFWNGSQVVTVADAPRDIDYAISMASVISYSYSGTARNARHNVVKVQYYDKNNENSAAYEYATDYDSIRETEQINEVEIRAFGCTSAGQAQRLARYTLLSEQTETRILTAKLSMDAFVNMQIGDVFAWSDKFLAGANNGGRVVAVNGAELTLDRDVTDSALVGDTLFVNTTSGKASTRTITAINGNKVTLDAVMATTEPEFVWVIDSAELSLLYFKLDDYKVNPAEGTVDIVGIQHVNSKFGTIDSETALEAPPFSKVEIETLRAPGNVITSFNVRVDQGLNIADLYVSWGQVKGATRYTVEFRRDSQAWRVLGNVTGLTHTIENVSAGIYEVRVRAADSIGNLSPYGFSAPINVAGIVLPPPKLASFTAVGKLLAIETKWSFPAGTEASLAVVIEHATQDPSNVGVPTQKLNIPYPQSSYTFASLGAHAQMWFRAAIVDKYNQEGDFTAWTTATADADPEELIDLISGHISEGTLDQMLKGKIDGAGALAGEAQTLANQAKADAANAATAAANAATKAQEAANAAAKEATDRAAAIAAQDTALKADATAKVAGLKAEIDPKITTLQNGITQVTTDYKAADTIVVGQLNAYKTSNDSAVASVLQKAESAVSTGATNSSAITAINGQISTINGALSTKLDASVISGYYTKGQTDAKAAEIAAGKVEEFSANLIIGGANLFANSDFSSGTAGWESTGAGASLSVVTDSEGKFKQVAKAVSTNNSQGFKAADAAASALKLVPGDTYTFSGWVRASEPKTLYPAVDGVGISNAFPIQVNTAWQYFTVTKKLVSNTIPRIYGNGEYFVANLKLEKGTKATDWTPSSAEVQNSIDANSTAIQNTNAEVSRVDGVATAANNATAALSGRVSAVEGSVATKAEAAALTALTTRVSNAEGVNTSQGTAITTLQNTVNHATTGLATKASTSALTATNSEVSRVNGVVTGHAGQLTQLAADITTINGNLATKADASALNDIYTKTQTDAKATEIAAGEVSKYNASLVIGGANLYTGPNPVVLRSESAPGRIDFTTAGTGNLQRFNYLTADNFDISSLKKDDPTIASIEVYVPSTTTSDYTIQFGTYRFSIAGYRYAPTVDVKDIPKDTWVKLVTEPGAWPAIATETGVNLVFNLNGTRVAGDKFMWRNFMMEKATKASAFSESDKAVLSKIDANATAIVNTNTEVSRVDGKTTVNANNISGLTSRMGTVEGKVSTKAEASALQNYYTKTEAEANATTVAAGEVAKYNASLVIGATNLLRNSNFDNGLNGWEVGSTTTTATVLDDTKATFKKVAKVVSTAATSGIKVINAVALNDLNLSFGEEYTFSGWLRADANMTVYVAIDGSANTNATAVPVGVEWVKFTHTKKAADNRIPRLYGSGTFYVANLKIERGNKATDWSEADSTIVENLNVNTSAITTTNTEVSRINGVVSGHSTQLSNLTASIAGKADTNALNALTVRVATEEGKSSSQASDLVSLSSSLGKNNLINKDAWRIAGNLGYISPTGAISVLSTHVYSDFIPVSTNQLSWALTDIGSGGNTSMRIAFYKDDKTFHSIPVNGGVDAVSSGIINVPEAVVYVRISVPLVHTAEAVFKSSSVDLSGYATAAALNSLTTRVSTAEGKISTEATKLTNLSTTVGGHTTTINSQTTSINGIRGVHALKIETNGVISGYGLISELVNGTVKSQFGINADNFFIGAPSSNKKPFVVLTTTGTINGVSGIPAGTYIDSAYIANATIKLAHINKASITSLDALSANLGTFVSTGADGSKTTISGALFQQTYPDGKIMVRLGRW